MNGRVELFHDRNQSIGRNGVMRLSRWLRMLIVGLGMVTMLSGCFPVFVHDHGGGGGYGRGGGHGHGHYYNGHAPRR